MAAQGWFALGTGDVGHVLMHWESQAHHHHDEDGSGEPHHDGSDESRLHVGLDACASPSALPASPFAGEPPEFTAEAPAPGVRTSLPAPFLEGPKRPPRSAA